MIFCRCVVKRAGFTRTELIVVIALLGVLLAVVLPALQRAKTKGGPTCYSFIREVGLAFNIWAADHNGKYPMQVSISDGGAKDFLDGSNFFKVFQVMSNELNNPKTLLCPTDRGRTSATNFTTDFKASHISYFLGLDATGQMTNSFLSGDGNLTNGQPLRNGILEATGNRPVGWTETMHHFYGFVAFGDGSVRGLSNSELSAAIQKTGMKTNRLALP